VEEQIWKRKEYDNWDSAFRGLIPLVRQQSVRVASYVEVLFVQACASSYGVRTRSGAEHMKTRFTEVAYRCGLYHQIGKALVPPEYQVWQNDFTAEEQDVYRKYTTDGRVLAAHIQEIAYNIRKKRNSEEEALQYNIPCMMIRESCQQHMERWDGTGYPDGRIGDEISPIAQIVGLAKELDRLAAETKSENPFEEAFSDVVAQSGTAFSPELIKILIACKKKCKEIYEKYVHYTMTLPKTVHLLEKRPNRPMGLSYRPMVNGPEGKIVAYEAIPWFGGIADNPSETENAEILEPQLRRLGLVGDVSTYFLYEVTDTLLRIENCKLSAIDTIVLDMIPSFFLDAPDLSKFETLFEHQPIDKSRLILTVPAFVAVNANPDVEKSLKDCAEMGIMLMVDSWDPDTLPLERVKELGFKYVRLHPDQYLKKEIADLLSSLPANGITAYAKDADTEDALRWLVACGVKHFVSVTTGYPVDEDSLIRDSLLREREDV
jgi:EAL domain-containing protein (putative c-di-GMP-specific phosphodiesterase class I)